MRESWTQRLVAVPIGGLGNNRNNGENDADKAVLEDADPDDLELSTSVLIRDDFLTHVEPCQAAPWSPQRPLVLASCTFLKTKDRPEPILCCDMSKVLFLLVQVGRDVVA